MVTSIWQHFARHVVEHSGLGKYIAEVIGFERSGSATDKARLLRTLLEREAIEKELSWMAGDRSYDVIAARQTGSSDRRTLGIRLALGARNRRRRSGRRELGHAGPVLGKRALS